MKNHTTLTAGLLSMANEVVILENAIGSCYGNFSDYAEECSKCAFAAECRQYCLERGLLKEDDFHIPLPKKKKQKVAN